jgi:hypothetical protein
LWPWWRGIFFKYSRATVGGVELDLEGERFWCMMRGMVV